MKENGTSHICVSTSQHFHTCGETESVLHRVPTYETESVLHEVPTYETESVLLVTEALSLGRKHSPSALFSPTLTLRYIALTCHQNSRQYCRAVALQPPALLP